VAKSGTGSVSTDELETKRGTVKESEGAVAEAKAKVDAAQLNVDWCKVTALISGRISDKRVSAGNMITGGGGQAAGTVLTTIKSVDPIYCNLDADEASVLKYQKQVQDKRSDPAQEPVLPCYMGLRNEVGFPHVGKIDFLDNRVNEATSTRRARGVFDNSDGRMLPGYFARIRLAGEILPHAILVIDDVVGTDQNRKYLYVLHADNTIEQRTVTVGPLMGELRVIQGGLSPDELVIVNGLSSLMMVRPGGKVNPTITEMPEHRLAAAVAAHNAVQDSDAAGKSGSAGQTQPASHGEGGR
jgi:RND family efflux transporter MFP subunit